MWTENKIAILSEHYNKGVHSASQLALMLGTTRSAVIGKANRLNLSPTRPKKGLPQYPTEVFKTCQYPYGHPGDDDFRFCGHPVDKGSYCQTHHDLCYRTEEK